MKYNELYKRNTFPEFWEEEEATEECNCGSFALNLTTWFVPYLDEHEIDKLDDIGAEQYGCFERECYMEELLLEGYDREDVMDIIIERDWEFILKACPYLKTITKEEINDTDRIIAYRLMLEECEPLEFDPDKHADFHFRVRIGGTWYEKNGNGPIHSCGTFTDESPWHCETWMYDSKIKYAKFVA